MKFSLAVLVLAANLRRAVAAFDRNHDGKLEPDELTAMMQFLQGSIK
jgi:Ca2+-binding EF-hand superfamily protein